MAWTDSDMDLRRSRQQLLADVLRRGARIRRRRRTATALVGALALVVPVTIMASMGSTGTRTLDLTVAGPPDRQPSPTPEPSSLPGSLPDDTAPTLPPPTTVVSGGSPALLPAPAGVPATAGPAAAPDRSTAHPEPPPGAPPAAADDPVVRPSAAPSPSAPSGSVGMAAGAGTSTAVAGSTTVPAEGVLARCAPSDVAVTVATDKEAYASGGTIRGFSTLENRSQSACLLPTRSFFRIEDASGADVSLFRYTTDYRLPAKVEPGATVTDNFTWDQRNCATGACVQVPSGTYMVSADWTEGGGSYGGRTSFRIGS